MDIFERFDETKLPNKEDFYSTLNKKLIIDKGYDDALRIWNESEMENMGKYRESRGVLSNGVLKICREHIAGEHPCRSVIAIKLLCNFIEITLRHGCSFINLLHIFRRPFLKNTSERLPLFVFKD